MAIQFRLGSVTMTRTYLTALLALAALAAPMSMPFAQ
jgi:hypothetical protein